MLKLVIHIGVSGFCNNLTMEQQASNIDYYKADNKGLCPDNWCVKVGAPATLSSRIDMGKLCSAVNNSTCDINAFLSQDCGK